MRSFGETISNAASNPFSKFIEVDEWFESKRAQLETLENQLKALLKSVEGVVKQRKELGGSIADFGESMIPLASAELDRGLSTHLMVLADVQKRMKELHEQQVTRKTQDDAWLSLMIIIYNIHMFMSMYIWITKKFVIIRHNMMSLHLNTQLMNIFE